MSPYAVKMLSTLHPYVHETIALAEPGALRMVTVGSSTPVVVAVGSTPINILRRALCRRWQQHPCCCRRWQQSPNKILRRALNCRRREQHRSCGGHWFAITPQLQARSLEQVAVAVAYARA